jgi:hypothetical protein
VCERRYLIGGAVSSVPSSPESQWFHPIETYVFKAQSPDVPAPTSDSHRRGPVRPADRPHVAQIDARQPGDDRRLHRRFDEVFTTAKVDPTPPPSDEAGTCQEAQLATYGGTAELDRLRDIGRVPNLIRDERDHSAPRRISQELNTFCRASRHATVLKRAGCGVEDALTGLSADHARTLTFTGADSASSVDGVATVEPT